MEDAKEESLKDVLKRSKELKDDLEVIQESFPQEMAKVLFQEGWGRNVTGEHLVQQGIQALKGVIWDLETILKFSSPEESK